MTDTALFRTELPVAGSNGPGTADGKEEGALRTIGEVAKALGIRQHVLRYWEEQFPMLKPLKRSGGRRYYRPEDIALVETIDRLVHQEGFTLRGARQALSKTKSPKAGNTAPAAPVAMSTTAEAIVPTNLNLRAHLIALRTALAKALHDS